MFKKKNYPLLCLFILAPLLIPSCGGEYGLPLGAGYTFTKYGSNQHEIYYKLSLPFKNYTYKETNLEKCLFKNQGYEQTCYVFSASMTIVVSNVISLGVSHNYIFGKREPPKSLARGLEGMEIIQPNGYFIIDKKAITVEAGLDKEQLQKKLSELDISIKSMKKINDTENMWLFLKLLILGEASILNG